MNEILEEFKIVFGFDDKPLQDGIKKTQNSLAGLGKVFGSIMASYVSFQALKAIVVDYANMNTQLGNSASLIGANVAELSAMGGALQYFGGSTESAVSAVKSLSGALEEAKRGQGALIEVSRKYGISINPYATPTQALKELSGQMGRFTTQQRLAISQQLGLDDSITRAFKDPKKFSEYIDKMERLGTATDEDVKISDDFNNSITYLKQLFNALTRDFARVILPSFTALLEVFTKFIEWVRKHKQLVVIFFTGLAIAMAPVLLLLGKMAIASAMAFAPLIATVAVISAIALVLEDVYGYFMGWDSVTGDLVAKFPLLGMLLEPLRPIAQGISKVFEEIVNWLKDPTWDKFVNIFKSIGDMIWGIVDAIGGGMNTALDGLMNKFIELGQNILNFFKKPLDDAISSIKSLGSGVMNFLGFGENQVPQAPAVPLQASSTNAYQANRYDVNNTFNQQISTATPKQFADSTNSQIANSINNIRQQQGEF